MLEKVQLYIWLLESTDTGDSFHRNHKEHIRLLYLARKKYSSDSMGLNTVLRGSTF